MRYKFTIFGIVPNFLVVCNSGIIFAPRKFDVNLIFRARLPTNHRMFSLIARSVLRIAVQGSREGVSSQFKRPPSILLESRGWIELGTTVRLHGLYYAQGTQLQDLEWYELTVRSASKKPFTRISQRTSFALPGFFLGHLSLNFALSALARAVNNTKHNARVC